MNSNYIFAPTELKNTGIIMVVMGMTLFSIGIATNPAPFLLNIMSISALVINLTGAGLLGTYYYKMHRKPLTMRLYLVAAMLGIMLVYYFAITHV